MNIPEINFKELNIKEIGSWPLMLRISVLGVIAIITLTAAYFFVLETQLQNLETQHSLNMSKRKEFKDKYNLAANLDAYQKQMIDIKESYKQSLKELPATDQLPELIESITRQAEENGLISQSIKPGDPKTVLGFYKELPLHLTLQGTYNGFGAFISDISKIPRIITIHDFSVKGAGSGRNNTTVNDALILDLDAKTYWLSTDKDPVPEVKTKTKAKASKNSAKPASKATPAATSTAPATSSGMPDPAIEGGI